MDEAGQDPRDARWRRWRPVALACGGALALTLLMFPTVLFGGGTRMVGAAGSEHMSGAWVFTWSQQSIVQDHRFPLVVEDVGREGGSLIYPLSLLTTIVTLPVYPLLDVPGRYNAAMIFNLMLAFIAAFALFRRLGRDDAAALPGAVMFALSPFLISHFDAGPPEGTAVGWIPLALLAAEGLRRGDRVPPVFSLLKGGAVGLAFAANPYYGVFTALAAAALTLSHPGTSWRSRLVDTALMAAASGALILPLGWVIHHSQHHPDAMAPAYSEEFARALINEDNPDLLAFFFPLRAFARPAVYLGLVALASALAGAIWARPSRRWLWIGLAGLVFALGGTLRIAGSAPTLGGYELALPARFLCASVPPFTSITHPFRALPLVTLTLGASTTLLLVRAATPRRRWIAAALLCGAIAVDALLVSPSRFPLGSMDFRAPAYLELLAGDGEDYAVLDVPMGHHDATLGRYLMYQRIHRKRIPYDINGQLIPLEAQPAAFEFVTSLDTGRTQFASPQARERGYRCGGPRCGGVPLLGEMGFRYLIVHRHLVDAATEAEMLRCVEPCLSEVFHRDEEVVIYAIPAP